MIVAARGTAGTADAEPSSLITMLNLAHLSPSTDVVQDCINLYSKQVGTSGYDYMFEEGYLVMEITMEQWKQLRRDANLNGDSGVLINYDAGRSKIIVNLLLVVKNVLRIGANLVTNNFRLYSALLFEINGDLLEALAIFSDLIAIQSQDTGLSLSAVILHAAAILMYLKRYTEAIEYLEYIDDDDIVTESHARLVIQSLLSMAYGQINSNNKAVLSTERFYKSMSRQYSTTKTDYKDRIIMLADSCIENCEYLWGLILLKQAKIIHIKQCLFCNVICSTLF